MARSVNIISRHTSVAFLVIFSSVFLGLAQTIFEVHASDYTDYEAPFLNALLSALTAPLIVVFLPTLVFFLAFLILRAVWPAASNLMLLCCVTLGVIGYGFRIYFLQTGGVFLSAPITFASFFGLLVFFGFTRNIAYRLFAVYSVIALGQTLYFSYDYFSFLQRSQKIETALNNYSIHDLKHPVFVLVFDEFSGYLIRNQNGEIDGELFPELKAFADNATWFPNALTPHTATVSTMASIVSGQDVLENCSENRTLSPTETVESIFARKCGTNNVFALPNVAPGVHVSGSKFGRTNIKLAAMRAKLSEKASDLDNTDATEEMFIPYVQALADTYVEGALNPSWGGYIFSALYSLTEKPDVIEKPRKVEKPGRKDKRTMTAEEVRTFVTAEELRKVVGIPADQIVENDKSIELFSFLRCVRKSEAEAMNIRHYIAKINTKQLPINLVLTDLTHVDFCLDQDGPVEVISPLRRFKGADENVTLVPDAMAVYNRAEGTCQFDDVANSIKRARINQSRLAMKLLGELINDLKEKGVYDDAFIVVMADHGRGFLGPSAGRRNKITRSEVDQMDNRMMNAAIPLLIKFPKQVESKKDLRIVQPKDVGATILDILDIEVPWQVDGTSVLAADWEDPKELRFLQSVIINRGKKIDTWAEVEAPAPYFESFQSRLNRIEEYPLPEVGTDIEKLKILSKNIGQIESLKLEHSIPTDGDSKYVLTLGGHSAIEAAHRAPKRTYISVNGKIVKAVKPCLVYKGKHHKWGDIPAGWVATLPPESVTSRSLTIRAFSPVDDTETEFYELAQPMSVTLTEEQFSKVSAKRYFITTLH